MVNFINPIDLLIALIIILIAGLGIKNGCILELKKIVNLFFSALFPQIIIKYTPIISLQTETISALLYFLMFTLFLFVIGFLIDLGIYRLPIFTIEENVNKLISVLLGALKSLILIAILLFAIDSLPIQKSVKENFFLKANKESILFKTCNNLKELIINQ